jgi:hypothetical protein
MSPPERPRTGVGSGFARRTRRQPYFEQCQSGFHKCPAPTLFFGHKRATNSGKEGMMPRFSIGARVCVADEKTNDRIGTVVEVLPKSQQTGDYDSYRIEFNDGTVETL